MNTINTATTNTTTANTVNNIVEDKQTATAAKSCGMTQFAGFLFWATVVLQFGMIWNDMIDYEFANHIIYHILPLTGALAYFGLKKDMAANAARKDVCEQVSNSDC